MDLDLAQGVMVGVVKEGDPMGNKEHWFVDTGGTYYLLRYLYVPPSHSLIGYYVFGLSVHL